MSIKKAAIMKVEITDIIANKVKSLKSKYHIDTKGNVYEEDMTSGVERILKWHYKKINTKYPYIIIRVPNDKEYLMLTIKPYYFSVVTLLAKAFLDYPIKKYGSDIRLAGTDINVKNIWYPEMKYSNNTEYIKRYKKLSGI